MRHIRAVAVLILLWGGAFAPPRAEQAKTESSVVRTKHALVVPFRFVHGHIFLSLSLNGHPSRNFILDSGASKSMLDRNTVAALRLPLTYNSGLSIFSLTDVKRGFQIANKVRIRVGRWMLLTGSVPVVDLNPKRVSSALGFHISGLIGYDYMRTHPVLIDFQSRTISIFFHRRFFRHHLGRRIRDLGLVAGAQLSIPKGAPIVHAGLELPDGRNLKGTFAIDTGSGSGIDINTAFIEKNMIAADEKSREFAFLSLTRQAFQEKSTKLRQFTLGNIRFAHPVALLPQGVNAGILAGKLTDGEIGNQILQQCGWVLFDPSDRRLILGRPSKQPRNAVAR